MERFIYVIGEDARDRLVNMGYHLLREDETKHIYVFLSQDNQNFSCADIQFADDSSTALLDVIPATIF